MQFLRNMLADPSNAFHYTPYKKYWIGSFVAVFGERFRFIASGWLVVQLTNSPAWLGIIALCQALPTIILSIPAGAIADKYDSKKLVYISDFVISVAHFCIAILTITGLVELWMLIIWSTFVGSIFAISAGGQNVLLPKLISMSAMTSAIAYTSGIWQTSRVIGPAAAGIAVAIIGPGYSLLMTSIGYLIASIAIFSILVDTSPKQTNSQNSNIMSEMLEGASYVLHNKVFLGLTLISFCASTFGTSYMILLPIFASDVLEVGAQGFGAMEAAAGTGAIIGTLLVIKFGASKKIGLTIIWCSALFGIALSLFALTKVLILSMTMLLIAGMFQSIYLNFSMTVIQLTVPDALRGRVMSIYTTTYFLISIGGFLSGMLAAATSVPFTIMLFALIVTSFAFLVYFLLPEVKNIDFLNDH